MPSNRTKRRAQRPKSFPPDPSHPDPLNLAIDARIAAYLSDPSKLPDEFTSYVVSLTSFNAIQSITG